MLDSKIIDITPIVCTTHSNTLNNFRERSKEVMQSYTVTLFLKFSNGNTNEVTLLVEGEDVLNEETAFLKAKEIIQSKIEVHLTKANKVHDKI